MEKIEFCQPQLLTKCQESCGDPTHPIPFCDLVSSPDE